MAARGGAAASRPRLVVAPSTGTGRARARRRGSRTGPAREDGNEMPPSATSITKTSTALPASPRPRCRAGTPTSTATPPSPRRPASPTAAPRPRSRRERRLPGRDRHPEVAAARPCGERSGTAAHTGWSRPRRARRFASASAVAKSTQHVQRGIAGMALIRKKGGSRDDPTSATSSLYRAAGGGRTASVRAQRDRRDVDGETGLFCTKPWTLARARCTGGPRSSGITGMSSIVWAAVLWPLAARRVRRARGVGEQLVRAVVARGVEPGGMRARVVERDQRAVRIRRPPPR